MTILDDDSFSFEPDTHIYRNAGGVVRPSVTQILKSTGIFDYSMVKPDVLENARRRGTNVHSHTEEFDRYGDIDPSWIAEDEQPYFEAWMKFRRESGFIIREIEKRMLGSICGVEIGGTPDRVGFFGANRYVIDIKTCSAKHPGWALQLCLYEMLLTQRNHCGHMGHMVVMLQKTGNYKTITYEDPADEAAAIAIVQKAACEESIANWIRNKGLKIAA